MITNVTRISDKYVSSKKISIISECLKIIDNINDIAGQNDLCNRVGKSL